MRQKVLGANIHETEGLLERNIAPTIDVGQVEGGEVEKFHLPEIANSSA